MGELAGVRDQHPTLRRQDRGHDYTRVRNDLDAESLEARHRFVAQPIQHAAGRADVERNSAAAATGETNELLELLLREVRAAQGDGVDDVRVHGRQLVTSHAHWVGTRADHAGGGPIAEGRAEIRRFGRHPHDVEQSDGPSGGGSSAERLKPVLRHVWREPVDGRDLAPNLGPQPAPENWVEHVAVPQPGGQGGSVDDHRRAPVLVQVETRERRPRGEGTADIQIVPVALGAGAKHGVGERDRVALAPRDVLAGSGPVSDLVRRTGPRGLSPHDFVRDHLPAGHRGPVSIHLDDTGVQQIQGPDVEGCRDSDEACPVGS